MYFIGDYLKYRQLKKSDDNQHGTFNGVEKSLRFFFLKGTINNSMDLILDDI